MELSLFHHFVDGWLQRRSIAVRDRVCFLYESVICGESLLIVNTFSDLRWIRSSKHRITKVHGIISAGEFSVYNSLITSICIISILLDGNRPLQDQVLAFCEKLYVDTLEKNRSPYLLAHMVDILAEKIDDRNADNVETYKNRAFSVNILLFLIIFFFC